MTETAFKFYLPKINDVRGAQNQYVTGSISDQRKFLKINLDATKRTYLKRAEVIIAKKIMTGTDKSDVANLPTTSNTIGPPGVVSVSEINYAFVDNTVYTIKIKAQLVDENNEVKTYFAEFGENTSYEYLHRIDGGDKFILPDLVVLNESSVEGAAGSNIIVKCPINFVNPTIDNRKPNKVSFLFDEVNNYPNQATTPNTDAISPYSIDLLPFDPSGNYTLPQTSDNKLINDKAYFVFISAYYSDGFSITGQFSRPLHVIARPVIDSVTAYGLASDQSDAGAATISSVMNVKMTPESGEQVNLQAKSGNITFELSQGGVVMYKADMPVSTTVSDGTILYTVLKENLVKVWTTTAPTQKSNGSYEYDVSAIIDHYSLYPSESILKKSTALTKTFTSDIVSLPSVVALNAWIAGANVATADASGNRTVDISNATTASGYALAPELGLVGKFSKNDFYGSGVTAGFFKDLDTDNTNHKFTVSVNGSAVPVPELYQIQGHDGKSDQEMYLELFESVNNGNAVSGINGVETVLTASMVTSMKASSNNIIAHNASESGWSVVNTGPGTNGATSGVLPKVILYFYANLLPAASQTASNSLTLNQASGIGMYAVFHQNATATEYPFFNVYTTPVGSNNKVDGYYKSRVMFSTEHSQGNTVADPTKVGMTLVYTGTDDLTLFPHIPSNRRVKYGIMIGTNLTDSFSDASVFSTEIISFLTLQTSSNASVSQAGNFNFRLLETGMFTSNANFDQVRMRYNVLSRNHTSANGTFPNLPGPASTLGSAQQPIFFWIPSTGIPSTGLFAQTNSVKVSVAIEPPAGETTRPAATDSNTVVAVSKVNQYVMTVGSDSQPRFSRGTLTVPVNNPTSSEAYFTHAIFTSNLAAPNALKDVSVSNGGVFDIAVENPNIRGANCNYQVRYKISDPNASGSITGPISATYSVLLEDEPGLDNFSVTNFAYKTFHSDDKSSFSFDIAFVTVGTKSVDGVIVYFQSTNDDADASNDIPLTQLMDVKKSAGSTQTNVSYTLQSVEAANASLTEGVKIKDKDAVASSNKWLNFRSGKIVYKPYKVVGAGPNSSLDIQNVQLDITMFNIPTIPMPANLTLTGGVKESYAATSAAWDDALSTYASISSSVTASYKLVLNGSEVSAANHGYTIDLSGVNAGTELTLTLQVKLTASDSLSYLSDTAELSFTAASVDVTGLTSVVKRGSNDTVLRVSRGDYAITPAGGANVEEVKLIDNQVVANTNPEAAQVKVLTCSSTTNAVQPVGPTVNVYDLVADGYALGHDLDLQYRLKAGVDYTTTYGAADPSSSSSTPLFLTLAASLPSLIIKKYVVATKPELQLESTYRVMSDGGTYDGRIAINASINAKGLHAEGVLSVVFVLAQEGNFTTDDMSSGSGVQYVISFEKTSGSTQSYTADSEASSTDNLGAGEVHELSVTNVAGFAEGGAGARTLVMGNLLANDASTLYLDATGFDASRPITAVSVVATRLGNDIEFKELTPSV